MFRDALANDGNREVPRLSSEASRSLGFLFSITVLECVFSTRPLEDGFREGKMRRNWGLEPSSLFFSPLLSEALRPLPCQRRRGGGGSPDVRGHRGVRAGPVVGRSGGRTEEADV